MKSGKTKEELEAEDAENAEDEEFSGKFPFACYICKKRYDDPVVTSCGHYFCMNCALKRYRKTGQCAVCGKVQSFYFIVSILSPSQPTHGIFNTAQDLLDERVQAWLDRVWKRRAMEEEEEEEDGGQTKDKEEHGTEDTKESENEEAHSSEEEQQDKHRDRESPLKQYDSEPSCEKRKLLEN